LGHQAALDCIFASHLYTALEVVIIRFPSLTQPKWIPKAVTKSKGVSNREISTRKKA
jgi:hypothetical protein